MSNSNNSQSEKELANRATRAYRQLDNFKATETVTAGSLFLKAKVYFMKPRKFAMEYLQFRNPLEEFERQLSGGREFSSEELTDTRFVFDGRTTWLHNQQTGLAVEKNGKVTYAPLGNVDLMGQLGFMSDIVGDYLLKSKGGGEVNGRKVQRIGLKPKVGHRSLFLKEEIFDFEKAVLALDDESGLPLKITFFPGEKRHGLSEMRNVNQLVVEYEDYDLETVSKGKFEFDPKKAEIAFREKRLSWDDFKSEIPPGLQFDAIRGRGFELLSPRPSAAVSEDGKKKYVSLTFLGRDDRTEQLPRTLQVLFGNYLSPEMNRHRSFLAEHGESVTLGEGELQGQFVNRGEQIADQLSAELDRKVFEIGWEREGRFAYFLAQGFAREDLLDLVESASNPVS
ncbi:MAG: LolA family protein [Candidatus Acetothermia bacterium]